MERKIKLLLQFERMKSCNPDVSVDDLFPRFIADAEEYDVPVILENWKSFVTDENKNFLKMEEIEYVL